MRLNQSRINLKMFENETSNDLKHLGKGSSNIPSTTQRIELQNYNKISLIDTLRIFEIDLIH